MNQAAPHPLGRYKRLINPGNWVGVMFFLALFTGCQTRPVEHYAVTHPVFTLAELQAYVKAGGVPVFDARDEAAYAAGHVPGAINLPVGPGFEADYHRIERILFPQKQHLVIVYCGDQWCSLADELQNRLIVLGYCHVGRFPGGWQEWSRQNDTF
jgi:rhodanese-related sulfurtransferase